MTPDPIPPAEPSPLPPDQPAPQDIPKPEVPPASPNPIAQRYADRLKVELGKNYSEKFDKMPLELRIDAMEATLDIIKKIPAPIHKGEGTALGDHAEADTKPKSFLEQQKEGGYRQKLRDRGSYATIAADLYQKK
jgi:hypothetical protein